MINQKKYKFTKDKGGSILKKIKEETIHTLARIGRKHRLLRYPILAVLVVFVFIYNVLLYGFIHFKMRERLARGLAMAMTVVLVFTSVDLTVLAMTGDPAQTESYEAAEGETPDPVKTPEGEEPENPEENAAPEESANPEASAAPEESANPEESAAPGDSANPEASAAPGESANPEASAAPGESASPEASAAPEESANPAESAAPETTAEPEVTPAPEMTVSDGNAQKVPENVVSLQQRINALPTVEEFIAMADGTYVEDSLWNEAQMNIYYELQDIADIYDSLTEEEQAMVDVTKLMELFDYINSAVMPLAENVNYEPITISESSLNGNAILGATESGTVRMDDAFCFYSEARYHDGGLPKNGQLNVNGIPYYLATGDDLNTAYDGNDCIRLTPGHTNEKMDLETIGVYQNIYVFATAGGPGTGYYAKFSVTLTYTEGETETETYKLYDWYDDTPVSGVFRYTEARRMDRWYDLDPKSTTTAGPIIHSAAIKVDSSRLLQSITFTMEGNYKMENGQETLAPKDLYCCIFAVTGATPEGVPGKPTATQATKDVADNTGAFTAHWNSVEGATGYRLDVARDRQFKDMVAGYNNENVGMTTECKVSGNDINKDTVYYYRVRAYNNKGQSLSSNRVATDLPKWIKNALEEKDYDSVSYDAETNTVTFNEDVTLKDTIQIPGEDSTVIDLNSNTVTAPAGKSAISANGKNTELTIKGNTSDGKKGSIVGSTGSDGNGVAAIDFSQADENSTITVSGSEIRGGDGAGSAEGTTTGNAGNGGAGIIAGSDSNVKVETNATVTGGNGGSTSNGNGGNGGAGISGGKVSVAQNGNVNGGNGGSSANGNGGNGGTGVAGSLGISSSGNVTGGNGGDSTNGSGGNGGSGVDSNNAVTNQGSVSGGNGGNGTEAAGAAGALNSGSGLVTGSGTAAAGKPGKKPQKGILSMKGYTYGDTVSVPTITGMQGDPQVTYYYNLTDSNTGGTEWKDIKPTTLNVGDYYLYAVLGETEEYLGYTTEAVKFTIGRRTITDDKVSIKINKNGKIEVTVIDPMPDDNKTLTEGTDYTVEKTETASDETFVIKGTGNYQFEITKKVSKPEWKGNDKGKTATTVVVEPGAEKIVPKMDAVSETDTKKLLTEIVKDQTVKQRLESADAAIDYNALLYLEVKQADSILTVDEKKLIADGISAAKELPAQTVAGKYIDLSLYMTYTVSDNTGVLESGTEKITDTSDAKLGAGKGYKQVIRLTIPEELRVSDTNIRRSYYILRVHDNGSGMSQVEVLDTTQEGYVITFETDKFSTYVIAYADQKNEKKNENENKKDDSSDSDDTQSREDTQNDAQAGAAQGNTNKAVPKTGDDSNILLWMLLLFGSACGMAGLGAAYCKRKKSRE